MRVATLAASFLLALGSVVAIAEEPKLNQPPEGFTLLFNGKDLTGWRGQIGDGNPATRAAMTPEELAPKQEEADKAMREHWKAQEGIIVFDGKGTNLTTAKDYGDFELYVDWKIEEAGDSGIYLRGTPQVQIWDPSKWEGVGSGGLYNNQKNPSKPLVTADKPIGEWNTFFIRMVGDKVTVKLNGETVVDETPLENYWNREAPLPATGPIELQNHGNTLYFRNVYVREL